VILKGLITAPPDGGVRAENSKGLFFKARGGVLLRFLRLTRGNKYLDNPPKI
jgi:hypothetical protein